MCDQLKDVLDQEARKAIVVCVAGLPVRSPKEEATASEEEAGDKEAGMNSLLYEFKNGQWPFQRIGTTEAVRVLEITVPALHRLVETESSLVTDPDLQPYL